MCISCVGQLIFTLNFRGAIHDTDGTPIGGVASRSGGRSLILLSFVCWAVGSLILLSIVSIIGNIDSLEPARPEGGRLIPRSIAGLGI
jgi:hypothetical protein